jgi:hypothetical protein
MTTLAFTVALALTTLQPPEDRDVPDYARREIDARGDRTEHITDQITQQTEIPPDDSHKWYVSLWIDDSPDSRRLLADWRTSPYLRAIANPDDYRTSWAHWHAWHARDPAQAWRLARYPITTWPTVTIQPPLNGHYGDPRRIAAILPGYTTDYDLARRIRDAIANHVQHHGHGQADPAESSTYRPPFLDTTPTQTQPQPIPILPPAPQQTPMPSQSTLQTLLLVALIAVQLWREYRRRHGYPLLLDDASYNRLIDAIRRYGTPSDKPPSPS